MKLSAIPAEPNLGAAAACKSRANYPYAQSPGIKPERIKTRMGISCQLFGALLFFMGLINILGLVLLAGYILLFEENKWLKKTAVKATVIVVVFAWPYRRRVPGQLVRSDQLHV